MSNDNPVSVWAIRNKLARHKIFDGDVWASGWRNTQATDLGDFEESLIIVLNDGVSGIFYNIQACADINDPDWYMWPSGVLSAGSGYFTSLQWPWGAVRMRVVSPNGVSHATVWVNTRLRAGM